MTWEKGVLKEIVCTLCVYASVRVCACVGVCVLPAGHPIDGLAGDLMPCSVDVGVCVCVFTVDPMPSVRVSARSFVHDFRMRMCVRICIRVWVCA